MSDPADPGLLKGFLADGVADGGIVDDAGFALVVAEVHGVPVSLIVDALAGEARSSDMPARAAVAVTQRLAARDLGAAERFVASDARKGPNQAFLDRKFPVAPEMVNRNVSAAELAEAAMRSVAAMQAAHPAAQPRAAYSAAAVFLADVAVSAEVRADAALQILCGDTCDVFADPGDVLTLVALASHFVSAFDDASRAALFGSLAGFGDVWPRESHSDGEHRRAESCVTAVIGAWALTLVANAPDRDGSRRARDWPKVPLASLDVTFDSMLSRRSETIRDAKVSLRAERAAVGVGRWMLACGVPLLGPGSIAERWGALRGELTDDALGFLADVAAASPEDLGALVVAATDDGARRRVVPGFSLRVAPVTLRSVAVFAALPRPVAGAGQRLHLTRSVVEWCANRPDSAEEVVAALETHRHVGSVVLGGLAQAFGEDTFEVVPRPLIDASMRSVGLEVWLVAAPFATRRDVAAAAEGIGVDRWRVLLSLLLSFRGTPAELVELTAELAPQN